MDGGGDALAAAHLAAEGRAAAVGGGLELLGGEGGVDLTEDGAEDRDALDDDGAGDFG